MHLEAQFQESIKTQGAFTKKTPQFPGLTITKTCTILEESTAQYGQACDSGQSTHTS